VAASEATEGVVYRSSASKQSPKPGCKVIAVLDDDQDATHSICAHCEGSGYDARPFYKTVDPLSAATVIRAR